MRVLHGFSSRVYYNALLEKQLLLEERLVYTGASDVYGPDYLQQSLIGKVPSGLDDYPGRLAQRETLCFDSAPRG